MGFEVMTWSEGFSVGDPRLDAQHQKLMEMMNGLYKAMLDGRTSEVLFQLLEELMAYTNNHFQLEEDTMAQVGFPQLDAHKAEHQKLTQKVQELRQKANNRTNFMIGMELLEFLSHWLVEHIRGEDQKYTPFIAAAVG